MFKFPCSFSTVFSNLVSPNLVITSVVLVSFCPLFCMFGMFFYSATINGLPFV